MRVLIDATPVPADRGGVGRYVDSLLPALAAIGVDIAAVVQARDVYELSHVWGDVQVVAAPRAIAGRAQRFAWEQTGLPALARHLGVSVLHSVHYTTPLLVRGPASVVTVHDATFFSDPELHTAVKGRVFRAATRHAVRSAGAVVVPSRATRNEVLRYVGGDSSKFIVAPHGVDTTRFHPASADEMARVSESLGLTGRRYVAFLGTLEPRKNVPALVRAWVRACGRTEDPPALVLAGGRGWDEGIPAAIDAVPAHMTVLQPGYLPVDDLPGFLAGAEVVVYPSLGEGFGLPVLEAMACGAPVLTTRRLSLPEVGGDAVAYAEPDEHALASALSEILGSPARRDELRSAGLRRASAFTWEVSARAHLQAYEAATAGPSGDERSERLDGDGLAAE